MRIAAGAGRRLLVAVGAMTLAATALLQAPAGAQGRIWMATEYIPSLPRVEKANWGTFIARLARRN